MSSGRWGEGVLAEHGGLLEESGIDPQVARERGYRSVTTKTELEELGFGRRQRRVPALLIPVWNAWGQIKTYQIRPDMPRVGRDGGIVKYETAAGTRMVVDVPPRARPLLGDPGLPLFVTEGARKADAAVSHGLCCVGVLGVWNFRGTNEQGGKTALPDWEQVALNNRDVYVAYDSDVTAKPGVRAALARLKAFLEGHGAAVSIVYLPPGEGGGKVWLDDFLAAGNSVADLLTHASRELPPPPPGEGEGAEGPYQETPEGLVWLKPSQYGVVPTPLTNFTATITGEVAEDDGVEQRRHFAIETTLHGRTTRIGVAASQFAGMGWVTEQLGAGAILFPGFGFRDHARAAIQLLSGDIHQQRLYTHLGWRKHDGAWCYLHAGGATGAVSGVAVQPPETLARFRLPDPPEGPELREAIMASLRLTGLAPDPVTVPVHAATVRSVLGPADFSLHLAGPTGAGKTELAALAQQHFGAGLDARHLPASWTSTPNALEGLAFAAKDALLVIDDFSPGGSHTDIQRTHQAADRVLRAQGNHSGRGRMSPDATLKPIKPPRGLILSTGEDLPRGQSLRARMLTVELDPETLDWQKLTAAQADAASGLYAQAIAGYLRWIAPCYGEITAQLPIEVTSLRAAAAASGKHRRTPLIVAELAAAAGYFLNYAQQAGAITQPQADERWHRTWRALNQAAAAQHRHHTAADPARRFCELLAAAIASGRAHITTADGQHPANPGAWGWHQKPGSREWQPQGDKIGWLTENGLYLEPDAAHAAAQKLARDSGETIPTGRQTLHKRLHEHGLLASTDEPRDRLTVRRTLQGKRRTVLHLHPDTLTADSPEHPNQPNHTPPRPATPASTEETAGPDGTNGTVPDTDPGAKHKTGGEPPPATDAPAP